MTRLDKLRHLYAAVGEEIEREERSLIRRQRLTSEIPYIDDADIEPAYPCGTEAGYQAHRHFGEDCEECRYAHAAHAREMAARRRLRSVS